MDSHSLNSTIFTGRKEEEEDKERSWGKMSHDWLKRVKTAFSKTFPFTYQSWIPPGCSADRKGRDAALQEQTRKRSWQILIKMTIQPHLKISINGEKLFHPSHRLERRDHIQRKNEKENMVEEGLVLIPSLKVIYHCYYSIDKRKTVL